MASSFVLPTAETIRDNILRVVRAGLKARGVSDPNVTPGSDEYIRAQAVGDQLEIAMANVQVKADAQMPDTAEGDDLARQLQIYGDDFRGAAGAAGNIVFDTTLNAAVVTGTQLIDGQGLRFEVTVGGTYANGDTIPVQGVDTGIETNHAAGDVLRWVTTPAGSQSTALVATGGLTGGVDIEDTETARGRLYARLRNPPAAGNAEHLCELAEASSTLVQKAFCSPCANGPASYALTVVGYTSSVSKSRVVPAITVTNTVAPYVAGKTAEYAGQICTTVVDVPNDVSIALSLPSSPKASPAGPGGGWTDGTPWPAPNVSNSYGYCDVTAVTSSSTFTVRAEAPPTNGVTQIAYLSPIDWNVYTATVTASSSAGAYLHQVTLDKPFPGIAVGHFISQNAENISTYFAAIVAHFASLGPGERVASTSAAFYRAYRRPIPATSWPMKLDSRMLRKLTDSGDEVSAADYLYRTSSAAPAVPALVTDPCNCFIVRNVGIYQKVE